MRIGIVGGGVVGGATARAFSGFVDEVRVYDVAPERRTHGFEDTILADIVFVCLPTPQIPNRLECDTSELDSFFGRLASLEHCNYVIRSTVPIGYTRKTRERFKLPNLVHSPEFLTARTATIDAMMPARNIIGVPQLYPEVPAYSSCFYRLEELYRKRFPHVPVHVMSTDESEAVKLFQNAFSAVKIATFNEFRCLADAKGLDWQRVMDGLLAGGWVHPLHTQVPGPDGKRGFGGACLVKDTANLASHSDDMSMCLTALGRNSRDREKPHS